MPVDAYAHFPSPIPEIIAATDLIDVLQTDLYDLPPLPTWHGERVVLIGDAAHAMTPNLGQGGAQAIEDAFVLAEQLNIAGSVADALRRYEQIRMAKAAWVVKTARHYGRIAHWRQPMFTWLRDTIIRATPARVQRRQFDRLYSIDH